jgi:hypothetical protein
MATNPTGTSSLVERAKNIILQPNAEWPRIDAEPTTIADIYKKYVIILAAIGPIAMLVGQQLFGFRAFGIVYKPSLTSSITQAVLTYVMSLVSIYVLALIIDALAPNFGGTKDPVKAFKVAAYSWTAAWLAGIFGIIPTLAILGIVGLYSLYLLFLGLPILMRAPKDKAMAYTAVTVLAAIVLYIVVGVVVSALAGAFAPSLPPSGSVTYTVPG